MLSIFYVCESIRPILNCFNRAIVKQITHPMMIEILHAQSNCKHLIFVMDTAGSQDSKQTSVPTE